MSCIRLSSVLHTPALRSMTLRAITTSYQSAKDSNDDSKITTTSVSELMTALKGLKIDGTKSDVKKKIGFSAAAEFKKRKFEKLSKVNLKKTAAETTDDESISKRLDDVDELVKEAAIDVAKTFPDQKKTESELLHQLMRFKEATTAGEKGQEVKDVSAILSGIKVQKESHVKEEAYTVHRDRQVAFDSTFGDVVGSIDKIDQRDVDEALPHKKQRMRTLFDRQRLNVFQTVETVHDETKDIVTLQGMDSSIWDIEAQKEMKSLQTDAIRNGFDEMIQLTEEGKLWTYPIDNERGLEEEQQVPFYEHIFLDQHLDGFPDIPEVHNFMELVLIGLGKNPYLTVQQKKEHIEWFRQYFENKSDILKGTSIAL